jgi:hypothetical protein
MLVYALIGHGFDYSTPIEEVVRDDDSLSINLHRHRLCL